MRNQLRLKESIYILKGQEENIYIVIFTNTRVIKTYKVDALTKEIINQIKLGTILEENVIKRAEKAGFAKEQAKSRINALKNEGIVYSIKKPRFSRQYIERFKRQLMFLSELATSEEQVYNMQKRLKNSIVTVFGIGGIGTWIVNGLAQIGIGEIRIVDPDIIQRSNLNRQLFFTSKDIGKYKVDIIKLRLPDSKIKVYKQIIKQDNNLTRIIRGSDFVVNCADNPSIQETTRILAGYCAKLKIPYSIAGGYNMHLGMLGPIIVPGETACFDCFLEYQKENDELSKFQKIKDIEQTGSLAPIAGMVANFHVMEIFKYLIGRGSINKNKFAELNFMDFGIEWRNFKKRQNCPTCGGQNGMGSD